MFVSGESGGSMASICDNCRKPVHVHNSGANCSYNDNAV